MGYEFPVEIYVKIARNLSTRDLITFGSCNRLFSDVSHVAFRENANKIYETIVSKIKQFIYLTHEKYAEKLRGLQEIKGAGISRLFKDVL
jgi:hypothetical protein